MTIFLDEFEDDNFVLFGSKSGISINVSEQRMIVFWDVYGEWYIQVIKNDEIRNVVKETQTANQLISINGGGARGIGQDIGMALKNASEKSKAKKASGITLELRSLDTPRRFLSFPEEMDRERVFEAVRQFLEGDLNENFQQIPVTVSKKLRRPTPEEIAAAEAVTNKRRVLGHRALKVIGLFVVVGAVVFFGGREVLKYRYVSSIDTPEDILSSSGLSCTLYYLGYDAISISQSGYVSHWVSRSVEVSAPATSPWGMEQYTFERGTFVRESGEIGNFTGLFRPGKRPLFKLTQFIPIPSEDIEAFVPLVLPPC